jgi:hypothetical protein
MATSFGALCTDFFINQTLGLKMDLPGDRETVLHLFDRMRVDFPAMSRFRRYPDELLLESPRREGASHWFALRRNEVRSGWENPEQLDQACRLHRMVLELCPFHLTISPLEMDYLELMFGFDLECKANHNQIVHEALLAGTPLGALMDVEGAKVMDLQPAVGISLDSSLDLHAAFEVQTRTSPGEIRRNRYRSQPISVLLRVRRAGPIDDVKQLPEVFDTLRGHGERLAMEKVVPDLLSPISRAIIGST